MGRPRKPSWLLSCRLAMSVHRLLEDYCRVTQMTKTATVEMALKKYIGEFFANNPSLNSPCLELPDGAQPAQEDVLIGEVEDLPGSKVDGESDVPDIAVEGELPS